MDDYLLWLLATTGLALLAGALWLRRRAARRQAELQAQAQRVAAESAESERMAAEQRREAAEQAERERVAAAEADAVRAAQRLAAEQAAREDAARAEVNHQAALRAEELRLAAQRAEADRVEAHVSRLHVSKPNVSPPSVSRPSASRPNSPPSNSNGNALPRCKPSAMPRHEPRPSAWPNSAPSRSASLRNVPKPSASKPSVAAAAPRRVVKTAAQTLVLVADDSKVVRIKTGRLLAQHHYQVAYASDGLDAVQQMQAQLPDVLITDVEMPGLDGFELTRQLRADPQTAQLPVIMITAADDRHREQADAAGVSVLLGKPYPEDALIAHIRQALGQDAEAALATGNSAHGALDALA